MKMLRHALLLASLALAFSQGPAAKAFITSAQAQQLNNSIAFTPTVQAAAYSTGNALGALQTLPFLQPASAGVFTNFMIMSKGGSTVAMTIYIFDSNPTASTCTDKTAFVLGAADVAKLAMAPFVLTPAVVGSGTTASTAQLTQTISLRNQDVPVKTALYICIVANGAVTPASTTDLVGKISAALD